jgi:hypothetical protein
MSQTNQTRMILTGGSLFVGMCFICIMMPRGNKPDPPTKAVANSSQDDPHAGHDHSAHDHSADDHSADDQKVVEEKDDTFELAKKRQTAIWDAEHITFELESKFGKSFKKHLVARDVAKLSSLIREDAKVQLAQQTTRRSLEQAGVSEVKLTTDSFADSDANGLAEELVANVSRIDSIERIKLRVLQIQAVEAAEQVASSCTAVVPGLTETPQDEWQTTLLLSVVGKASDGSMVQSNSTHDARFIIEDEDTLGEIPSVSAWSIQSTTFRVGAKPLMKETTADVGLKRLPLIDNWNLRPDQHATQYRYQIAVADYNKDGLLDIAVAAQSESFLLSRPSPDKSYHETTFSMFIKKKNDANKRNSNLAAWIDYDNDGWPDLLLGSRLYHNEEGKRFNDVTNQSGLTFGFQAMGAHVVDYDCDGLLDLYILDQGWGTQSNAKMSWIDDSQHGKPNSLWKNMGDGVFKDVTKASNAGGGNRESLAACWFFYDDDHFPDLYIANDFGRNLLLRNKGDGTFEDLSEETKTSDFATTMGAVAGDLDNDSINELYVANMYSKMGRRIIGQVEAGDYPAGVFEQIKGSCAGNRLYWRKGKETAFEELGAKLGVDAVGWAYAPAMIDINNDGFLDLYATTGFLSFDREKPDG